MKVVTQITLALLMLTGSLYLLSKKEERAPHPEPASVELPPPLQAHCKTVEEGGVVGTFKAEADAAWKRAEGVCAKYISILFRTEEPTQ